MSDWIGTAFLLLLLIGAVLGLRALERPRPRTSDEFERNAAEGTTALGASMNALQELMNPEGREGKRSDHADEGRASSKKEAGGKSGSDGQHQYARRNKLEGRIR
ncbi:hypothetical protein BH20ACI2_BH20ACI2_08600 [soil metagenome]